MSDPRLVVGPRSAAARLPEGADDRARLRVLAREMEGVFLNQLFQAMRQSLDATRGTEPSSAESMYASLLDQTMADVAAQRMERGLSDVLYRQLLARLEASERRP